MISSQFSSVTQSCPTLCDPVDCSTPGFPVHHQLPELTQTHVLRVGHPAISSSVIPFSSRLQSFPAVNSAVSVIMLNDNISRLVVGKQAFTWLLKCQADVEKICYLLPTVMWSSLGKWGAPWGRAVWTMQGPGTDVACGQEVLVWANPWRVTPIWEVFGKGKARVKSQESRGQQSVWVAWWRSASQQGDWCLRQTCSRSARWAWPHSHCTAVFSFSRA